MNQKYFLQLTEELKQLEAAEQYSERTAELHRLIQQANWKFDEEGNCVRKEKEPKFSYAHFPEGTIFEVNAFGTPEIFTAKEIVCNAPGSYVIVTTTYDDVVKMDEAYNITHVTRILKRGEGKLKLKDTHTAGDLKSIYQKHSSRYAYYWSAECFIIGNALPLVPFDAILDREKMVDLVYASNMIHKEVYPLWDGVEIHSISKKKLKRFIRRNLNRCLTSVKEADKAYQTMWDEIYEKDFEHAHNSLDSLFTPFHDDTPAITAVDLMAASVNGRKDIINGVLTSEEAQQRLDEAGGAIWAIGSLKEKKFFFTDDYSFGYGVLPKHWVPTSSAIPMRVVPREGLEDGVINNVEKWIRVFEHDRHQITSMEELLQVLNGVQNRSESFYDDQEPALDERFCLSDDNDESLNNVDGFIW